MTSPRKSWSQGQRSRNQLLCRLGTRTVFLEAAAVAEVVAAEATAAEVTGAEATAAEAMAVEAAAAAVVTTAVAVVCGGSRVPLSLARSLSLALGSSGLVNTWTEYQRSCISLSPSQLAKLI